MEKRFIERYFYKKRLDHFIDKTLNYHIGRIKKSYLKKVLFKPLQNGEIVKDANAFINTLSKPAVITIQHENIRKIAHTYLIEFLNDNMVNLLRHEFAHLKYLEHGKNHSKWLKEIDLFKKDGNYGKRPSKN